MNYTPQTWENNTLGPIFSEMLYANDTVAKSLVRVLENIKHKQTVTTLGGDLTDQPYAVNPVSAGNLNFADAVIEPEVRQVVHKFDMFALRGTRFGADMKSGAAQMESSEFLKAVLEFAIPKVGKAIERRFWTSLVAKLEAAASEIGVAGVALTASNIVAEFEKIYSAMPGETLSEAKIYAPENAKQLIKVANLKQTYRDIFSVSADKVEYLGVPVEFVPLPANTIVAGRSTDLILGTDLAADFAKLEVGKVDNIGDEMFLKATYSLGAAVCVPNQKVLYKA
ncbi:hypothetical protein [Solirubrum puertoriconensis]|uniref:Capsid protein n=1 Tax=Solirubrum puertoriconensis TaxID=1751427 RepID=A0A9X0HK67_SOLP1|nr:hypothetical protein [Solirubrum puertoriconensis]KUG07422.1 hypothetical protein ASU33_13800 [Solirubrum puertoriconensis]